MKNFLKILLVAVVAIVAILTVLMLVIGKDYHYEKSIVVNASPEKVYSKMSSTKAFNEWNPWMSLDPNLNLSYSGTQGQIGDTYCWVGNEDVGEGCHEITGLVPNKKQSTKMMFKKPFEDIATSDIVLTPEGNQTKVTWSMDCDLDYPMNLMKLMMDGQMDESYGKGLENLKKLVEQN